MQLHSQFNSVKYFEKNWLLSFLSISILFLPYISNTQFRLDQFIPIILFIIMFAYQFISMERIRFLGLHRIFLFYLTVFSYMLCVICFTNGPASMLLNLPNSFSYPLVSLAVIWFFFSYIFDNFNKIVFCLFVISILINIIGLIQFFLPNSPFNNLIVHYYGGGYGGGHGNAYGKFANAASLILLAAHRPLSIFVNPMAYGLFDLLVLSIAIGSLKDLNINKVFLSCVISLCVLGGFISSCKSFFYAFFIFYIGYFIVSKKNLKTGLAFLILSLGLFVLLFWLKNNNRFIAGYVHTVSSSNYGSIFYSRYTSNHGYLDRSGAISLVFDHLGNFLFGQGRGVWRSSWADSGFLQVIQVGGIFVLISYYSLIVYLIYKIYNLNSYCGNISKNLSICLFAFLVASVGSFVFALPRLGLLTFIISYYLIAANSFVEGGNYV